MIDELQRSHPMADVVRLIERFHELSRRMASDFDQLTEIQQQLRSMTLHEIFMVPRAPTPSANGGNTTISTSSIGHSDSSAACTETNPSAAIGLEYRDHEMSFVPA